MTYRKEIEIALKNSNPTEDLRNIAVNLNEKGVEKEEIYSIFYGCSLELYEEERDVDAELLEDIMDMVTGWYVGRNIR